MSLAVLLLSVLVQTSHAGELPEDLSDPDGRPAEHGDSNVKAVDTRDLWREADVSPVK